MAQPFHKLLATSLRNAKKKAKHQIIKTEQLSRLDRERLIRAGYLQKIIRGWYLFCKPGTDPGENTPWYASFWDFIRLYLTERFDEDYCLSPEASIDLYLGKNYLPPQIVVMAKSGGTISLQLPHNTSLLIYQEKKNFPKEINKAQEINVLHLEYAICKMAASFYQQQPQEAEIAIRMLKSPEKILRILLKEGMAGQAGRIIGALRHLNKNSFADTILKAMTAAGFAIIENNPFQEKPLLANTSILKSPYSARIKTSWEKTRTEIIKIFPQPVKSAKERKILLENVDNIYIQDAYHSLSIEGYQVSEELIEKIASGSWQPEENEEDHQQKNAMAAKGYYEAFKAVKNTINKMIKSNSPIEILHDDFSNWYLALFSPAVTAGIISAEHLAGFRDQAVYIRNAMHIPPPFSAVRDCMETLFECLKEEEHPAVKAVLTHWLIGFIHPYVDGNGRMARFAMNALLVSGGYPWTIIHLENRKAYLDALEKASINGNIHDFCKLILKEMNFNKSASVFLGED
jgi:Fic family protein